MTSIRRYDDTEEQPDAVGEIFAAYASPAGTYSAILVSKHGYEDSEFECIRLSSATSDHTVRFEHEFPDTGEVPPWHKNPLTSAGFLLLPLDTNGVEQLSLYNVPRELQGDDTNTLTISLDADADGNRENGPLRNMLPPNADWSETGVYDICGIGSPDGMQTFAVCCKQLPLGHDSVVLLRVAVQNGRAADYSLYCLPQPFRHVAMHPMTPNAIQGQRPAHLLDAVDVALTPTHCLVRGFELRRIADGSVVDGDDGYALQPGVNPASIARVSVLRCYDTATLELIWAHQDTADNPEWLYGYIVAVGDSFYVSALPANCLRDNTFANVAQDQRAASLLKLSSSGALLRMWPNVMQPNTPFAVSSGGEFCANLHSDGTHHVTRLT